MKVAWIMNRAGSTNQQQRLLGKTSTAFLMCCLPFCYSLSLLVHTRSLYVVVLPVSALLVTGRLADGHKHPCTACCFDPSHCGCEVRMNDPAYMPIMLLC